MSNRLGGKQGTAYVGTNANQPPNYTFGDRDPNQNDKNDVSLGDLWLNQTSQTLWVLVSLAGNPTSKGALATWVKLEDSGFTPVDTFTTDAGNAIPAGGVLNILGGQGMTTTGAGNTVTVISTGVFYQYVNVTTSPYVVLTTDLYLSVDTSTIPITIQLPNSALLGEPYVIKDRTGNASVHNITVTTVGGAVDIDGATTFVMDNDFQATSVLGNGTTYELY
jgi:hypothetical protein